LLSVEELSKQFSTRRHLFGSSGKRLTAVEAASLEIQPGGIYGLVGESGSGKSTLARCILQLVSPDQGRVVFDGRDLCKAGTAEMRLARQRLQIVFQDPLASLSPRRSILQTLREPLEMFDATRRDRWDSRCLEVLEQVGLDREILSRLPQHLSSGQRQRVGFARALLTRPDLIVADEAVSALDVSVQAQILQLVRDLRDVHGIAFLFISHDLAVIAQVADQVGVMFRGRIVESGPMEAVFTRPAHPYTRQLLSAIPDPDPAVPFRSVTSAGLERGTEEAGCVFAGRCPEVMERCRRARPPSIPMEPGGRHRVECLLHE